MVCRALPLLSLPILFRAIFKLLLPYPVVLAAAARSAGVTLVAQDPDSLGTRFRFHDTLTISPVR
jgi:hypothetical protein